MFSNPFRQIIEFHLERNPETNRSKRIAYCRYSRLVSSNRATSNKLMINGHEVDIDRAHLV